MLEKKQKIQWRASSGDGAPKLQISVPCRGRTCPEIASEMENFEREWNFRASHPPRPYFLWGKSRCRDWSFRARFKFSIEIDNSERDWIFLIVEPSGNVQKLSRGAEDTFFRHFWDNFCLFGRCCRLVNLSNARPLQLLRLWENKAWSWLQSARRESTVSTGRITLSFLSLFFWKMAGKTTKKTRIFFPTEPPKSLEKKGKTVKKTRKSLQGQKTRNSKKTRKGRTGYRVAQEPNRNRKPEPSEPFSQEPNAEPEPTEPFP